MRISSRFAVAALFLSAATAAHANLIANGSFESGSPLPNSSGGDTFISTTSSTTITGWTATNIDWVGNTLWQASNGVNSVDLNGFVPGSISQSFTTTVGAMYNVSFDLAGNNSTAPVVKTMQVSVGGITGNYSFDTTGHSGVSMGYVTNSFSFIATSALSTLTFTGTSSGASGAVIDNVIVNQSAVPEPGSLALFGFGLSIMGYAARRRWS